MFKFLWALTSSAGYLEYGNLSSTNEAKRMVFKSEHDIELTFYF